MRILLAISLMAAVAVLVPSAADGTPAVSSQLYGFISSDRTLTYDYPGPIYEVLGDVVIQPGATLTIEPGVMLRVATFDLQNLGLDGGHVEFDVQGSMVADAVAGDSIRFVSAGGGTAEWSSIRVTGAGTLTLKKVAVRGAIRALNLLSTGYCVFEEVGISAVREGVWAREARFRMAACSIVGQGDAPYTGWGLVLGLNGSVGSPDSTNVVPSVIAGFASGLSPCAGATVRNVIVRDNYYGVWGEHPTATLNYCTVVRNVSDGVVGPHLTLNTIVALNGARGIFPDAGSFLDYIDVWHNSVDIGGGDGILGPHVTSSDPLFVDAANNDFHLSQISPFKQFSNSGGEIGAYGPGPGGATPSTTASWGHLKSLYR